MFRRFRNYPQIGGAKLPYDAEVEWLRCVGTSYIDTGFYPSPYSSVSAKVRVSEVSDVWKTVIGCRSTSNRRYSIRFYNNSSNNGSFFQKTTSSSGYSVLSGISQSQASYFRKVEINKNGGLVDGKQYGNFKELSSTSKFAHTLFIFACNMSGIAGDLGVSLEIGDVEIADTDVLMILKPVRYTDENGVSMGAMYDISGIGGMNSDGSPRNDGLYCNRGTDAFAIGPDKAA